MTHSYILISTMPSMEHIVFAAVSKLPEVEECHILFGDFDILLKASSDIMDKVRNIYGIIDIKDLPIAKP